MRKLEKPVSIISHVFDLLVGDNFATPATQVMTQYPYLELDI